MPLAALLLLTDGRFPGGGYAHSAGLEAQAAAGLVRSADDVGTFLAGRLETAGLVEAAVAGWVAEHPAPDWGEVDGEVSARILVPALRRVSRARGRQLARTIGRVWPGAVPPGAVVDPDGPHAPVVLGLAARASGLGPDDAALAAAYDTVTVAANAAVRLLGLDPFAVQRQLTDLGPAIDRVAAEGAAHATAPLAELPARSAPLSDIHAELHARWEVRLFAS